MSKKEAKEIVVENLTEAALAEICGFQWKYPQPSPNFVPGIGVGATEEATRWAFIGYRADMAARAYAAILIGDEGQVGPDSIGEIMKSVEGSERAQQLVRNGLFYEMQLVNETDDYLVKQRKRGRPKKGQNPLNDKDRQRAFSCWHLLRIAIANGFAIDFTPEAAVEAKNRMLIELAIEVESRNPKAFGKAPLFSRRVLMPSLEESVSRGKTKLDIDENWRSELCEKIRLNL